MSSSLANDSGVDCIERHAAAGSPAAGLLALAAAPTFAIMALWSLVAGAPPDVMCGADHSVWSPNGMAVMYALMSVFHSASWLTRRPPKLIDRKKFGSRYHKTRDVTAK